MAEANSPFSLKDSIMAAIVPAIAEYIDEVEEKIYGIVIAPSTAKGT
jgi:hypothetical protein